MRDALRRSHAGKPHGSRSSFLTYEPYYGLKEKAVQPFRRSAIPLQEPDARHRCTTNCAPASGAAKGMIVLTGEIGTGKTTLCRSVVGALDRKTFCAFVPDPFVSREDLLKMLLIEFGVMSVEDLKSGRLQTAHRDPSSAIRCMNFCNRWCRCRHLPC